MRRRKQPDSFQFLIAGMLVLLSCGAVWGVLYSSNSSKGDQAKSRQELQAKLDAFSKTVRAVDKDGSLFEATAVEAGRLRLTVTDLWHVQHYQTRLQMAQNLRGIWIKAYSPDAPAKALMDLVDHNGNRVGGTGLTGVWVDEH